MQLMYHYLLLMCQKPLLMCQNLRSCVRNLCFTWTRGAMDNASAYGAEDSRFESWRARYFFFSISLAWAKGMRDGSYFVFVYREITSSYLSPTLFTNCMMRFDLSWASGFGSILATSSGFIPSKISNNRSSVTSWRKKFFFQISLTISNDNASRRT